MQLSVTGKHLDVGESLRDHATSAIAAKAERYFGRAIEGKVVFQRDAGAFRADIMLHVTRRLIVQAHGEATDPYLAFDAAAERLDKRLRRNKRRLVARRREADGVPVGGWLEPAPARRRAPRSTTTRAGDR
jgi:ribosomal subunit interface protein